MFKVLKLCSKCNVEFELHLVETNVGTIHNFQDCPTCGTRNDSWIFIKEIEHNCENCKHDVAEFSFFSKICSPCKNKSTLKSNWEPNEPGKVVISRKHG